MIVVCISDDWWDWNTSIERNQHTRPDYPCPIKDDLYEVVCKAYHSAAQVSCYELREFPPHSDGRVRYWDSKFFREIDINISDIRISEKLEQLI